MGVTELFCHVDAFWKQQSAHSHPPRVGQHQRMRQLCESEIMTVLILFHQSHYRTFKAFYTEYVCLHLRAEFPGLVSYTRFVEYMPTVLLPAALLWHLYRHLLCGCHRVGSMR